MRKTVSVVASALLALSLCACGTSGGSQAAPTAESAEATQEEAKKDSETEAKEEPVAEDAADLKYSVDESIDFSLEGGNIKFNRVEKANDKLTEAENVLIFVFDFTNEQDKPSQTQSVFKIQFFQNGTELKNNLVYSGDGGEQYELVQAFFNDAMKGGTVTFGKLVEPKDDSPITVMVSLNGGSYDDDAYQMMEVTFGEGAESSDSSKDEAKNDDSSSEVSAEDVTAALQGSWKMGENDICTFDGDSVTLENEQVTLSGTYELNLEKSAIVGHLQATDGVVDFALLYEYDGETIRIFKNMEKTDEMTKM